MAEAKTAEPSVKGSLPLYKNPVPLNKERHKGKGLRYTDRPFDFLAQSHFVPLTIGEFGVCAGRFPIIFLGEKKTAVAAMGLRTGENLFVDPDTGNYEPYTYLPAFVRRYPFVAAVHGEDSDRFTVCVDEGSHLYSSNPEIQFFDDKGEPTEFTQRAIDYVRRFEADVRVTQDFVKKIEDLGLFTQQEATFQPRDGQGQPVGDAQKIASYWGVDGGKLRELDPKVLAELRDNTFLGAIYAHMLSMTQWEFLIQRASARQQGDPRTPGPVNPPPAPEA